MRGRNAMKADRFRLKAIWLAAVLAILLWSLYSLSNTVDPQQRFEIVLRYLLLMLAASFPLGFIVMAATWRLLDLACGENLRDVSEVSMSWIVMSASGYLQWFHLAPWLLRRRRRRSSEQQSECAS